MKQELKELQTLELLDAKQKVHVNWLTQGDQGTVFFENTTKHWQAQNSVMQILYDDGSGVICLLVMKNRVVAHFIQLFHCEEREEPLPNLNELNAWMC